MSTDTENSKGIITRPSNYPVKETISRLEKFLQEHGATIYSRIDQQAELAKAGLTLAPLEFLLFGNPKGGGPAMIQNPLAALDLPLKVIAWEDKDKKVWIAYNEGSYIQSRYSLPDNVSGVLNIDPIIQNALG
jgi:uncharacterized protein (DUF302 family)